MPHIAESQSETYIHLVYYTHCDNTEHNNNKHTPNFIVRKSRALQQYPLPVGMMPRVVRFVFFFSPYTP